MPRVIPSQLRPPTFVKPKAVTAESKKAFKDAFTKAMTAGSLEFHASQLPMGTQYVRVPLNKPRGADQYTFTALVPVGALAPGVKPADPNKAKEFFVERSGGLAGMTMVGGPVKMGSGGKVTVEPFFSRFLDSQDGGVGRATTMKHPSDGEDGGGRPIDGGGRMDTAKYPSDAEDGGGRPIDGGGRVDTAKYPSDAEDGGGRPIDGGASATEKFPSDNDEGGTGPIGGGTIGTEKFPSDNDEGGRRVGGGGRMATQKYPSDNEDSAR